MPPPQLPKVGKNLYNQGLGKGANNGGRVSQPESIVCYVCRREKPHTQYSGRQLAKHKGTIYQSFASGGGGKGKPSHRTTCKTCTADQTTELTCIVCGETNGLDHFARTQRKNPDTARCKACINKQANIAPDLEMPDSDDYASSDDEEDEVDFDTGNKEDRNTNTVLRAGTSYASSSIHTNTLTSANLNRLEQATGSAITPRPGVPQAADGWVTKTRQPPQQLQSETMTTMTYDSAPRNANGPQDPSSISNTETFDSRAPLRSIPPKSTGAELRKNGWAKVTKVPKKGQGQNGFGSDDGHDDAEGSVTSSASAWTDRKKTVRTDFDDDPWSRHYK
ncbi:hypothetical protein TWF102_007702 [Orbilia oligospora]|uniref:Stc1 domain-containing protein n=1 Tax=Orbilia oligospora TaxID=2813651 RepID=A0A7C8J8K4_ORBOL|nr:hypothetical protein TWF102_007702 [Orbilia oligospora]KAF3101384.1 hypothetical protein TWF103_007957 [Orbilia oligospora]KAF3129208.1 hypothetical protein TWF703_009052 [Orbilia oligospora]